MKRRGFIALLGTSSVGAWAASKFPALSVEAAPVLSMSPAAVPQVQPEPKGQIDIYTRSVCPRGDYTVKRGDDIVVPSPNSTVTLPRSNGLRHTLFVDARNGDATVRDGKSTWELAEGSVAMFSGNGTQWFLVHA